MADKSIGDLPKAAALYDNDRMVLEQNGEAKSMEGALLKSYILPYAQTAEQAAEAAESALEGVREAIEAIPEGTATPIVNDLTTGGASMALSAEMGKKLNTEQNKLLPLDGSKPMTGNLTVEKTSYPTLSSKNTTSGRMASIVAADSGQVYLYNQKDGNNRQILFFNKEDSTLGAAIQLQRQTTEKGTELFNILHTGNKPSGSYTGNGSATSRTVDAKGVGDALLIYNSYNVGIITKYSSFFIATQGTNAGTIKTFKNPDLYFANGVLHCATADTWVNGNGTTYNYQVL